MKNKIVVLLVMFLSFIIPVSADENINGAPISKYKESENSINRIEIITTAVSIVPPFDFLYYNIF